MDACAAWLAAYPVTMFLLPSVAAAGMALSVWRHVDAVSGDMRRIRYYGAMALAAALGFAVLALSVHGEGGLVVFDTALAGHLGVSVSPRLLHALSWFTHLGDRAFLTGVAIALTVLLLARRRWLLAVFCVAATGGGGALNWLLKHGFQRVRPDYAHGYAAPEGWSFPSGHASAAIAVYGTACYLLLRIAPARWRPACVAVTAALVVAIGVSRILLQVHFASDVAAGFAASGAWLALCVAVVEHAMRRDAARR